MERGECAAVSVRTVGRVEYELYPVSYLNIEIVIEMIR